MKQLEQIELNGRCGLSFSQQLPVDKSRFAGLVKNVQTETARKVERSIAYMVNHINQPLQVSTLAALVSISPSHFFALFKRRTGCPPMDYFTRLRMFHAGHLLGSTSASVKEVAAAMGYDDPFYFSRVFKSVHKIAPSEYRSQSKELPLVKNDQPGNRKTGGKCVVCD